MIYNNLSRDLFIIFIASLFNISFFSALLDSTTLSTLISVITITFLFYYVFSLYGLFDPRTIFIFTAIPYIFSAPIDIYILKLTSKFDEVSISWLLIASTTYLFTFILAIIISNKNSVRRNVLVFHPRFKVSTIGSLLVVFNVIYLIIVAFLFSLNIGAISRGDIYSNKPLYFDLYKLFMYSFTSVCFWYLVIVRKEPCKNIIIPIMALCFFLFVDFIILGDRRLGVTLLLIICYYYSFIINYNSRHWLIMGGFIFFVWLLGSVRNTPISQWKNILSGTDYLVVANPATMEFGAFPVIWQDIMTGFNTSLNFTYIKSFLQLIPGFIINDRPIPPSVWFVENYYPKLAAIGGGLAFNAVAESLLNFSFLGPLISGWMIGRIFSKLDGLNSESKAFLGAIYMFSFAFFMRNDFVTVLRTSIIYLSLTSLVCLFFCKIQVVKIVETVPQTVKTGI